MSSSLHTGGAGFPARYNMEQKNSDDYIFSRQSRFRVYVNSL